MTSACAFRFTQIVPLRFSYNATMPRLLPCPQALPIFLRGLEVPVQRETLHSGVRQYLHRMIICLGDELLQFIPMTVQLLLKECSVSEGGHWSTWCASV